MIVAVPVSQPRSGDFINDFKEGSLKTKTCEKFQQSLVFPIPPFSTLQLLHRPLDVPLTDVKEYLQSTFAVNKTRLQIYKFFLYLASCLKLPHSRPLYRWVAPELHAVVQLPVQEEHVPDRIDQPLLLRALVWMWATDMKWRWNHSGTFGRSGCKQPSLVFRANTATDSRAHLYNSWKTMDHQKHTFCKKTLGIWCGRWALIKTNTCRKFSGTIPPESRKEITLAETNVNNVIKISFSSTYNHRDHGRCHHRKYDKNVWAKLELPSTSHHYFQQHRCQYHLGCQEVLCNLLQDWKFWIIVNESKFSLFPLYSWYTWHFIPGIPGITGIPCIPLFTWYIPMCGLWPQHWLLHLSNKSEQFNKQLNMDFQSVEALEVNF